MENNKGERGGVSGGRDRGRVGCGNGGGGRRADRPGCVMATGFFEFEILRASLYRGGLSGLRRQMLCMVFMR